MGFITGRVQLCKVHKMCKKFHCVVFSMAISCVSRYAACTYIFYRVDYLYCHCWTCKIVPVVVKYNHYGDVTVGPMAFKSPAARVFFNCLFWITSKKTWKPAPVVLWEGNPSVTGGFPQKGPVTRKVYSCDDVVILKALPMIYLYQNETKYDKKWIVCIFCEDINRLTCWSQGC